MTEDIDKQIEELVKDLKKTGINVIAFGKATDLVKLMKEKEYSDKIKEEGK